MEQIQAVVFDAYGTWLDVHAAAAKSSLRIGSGTRMALVSSNSWDACGAQALGFRAFRFNRGGQPVEYGPREAAIELAGLAAVPAASR
jgi:FMN phosphatase YigB (HAD superfamily)